MAIFIVDRTLFVLAIDLIVISFGSLAFLAQTPWLVNFGQADVVSPTIWPTTCSMPISRLDFVLCNGRQVSIICLRVANELSLCSNNVVHSGLN